MASAKTLYFFFATGCSHCAEAAPHVDAFANEHLNDIAVVRLNLALRDWVINGWSPKYTPGYLFWMNSDVRGVYEGGLTFSELKKFVAACEKGEPYRDPHARSKAKLRAKKEAQGE